MIQTRYWCIGLLLALAFVAEKPLPGQGPSKEYIRLGDRVVAIENPAAAAAPDLIVLKTHTGNFAQNQTGATYTITVQNVGSAATSGTVTVVDTVPTGLTATVIDGTGWSCTLSTKTCTRSNSLSAGTSYPPITLTVDVASNAPATVTNSVTVSGGGESNTTNNTANDSTNITPSGGGSPTFTYSVAPNTGTVAVDTAQQFTFTYHTSGTIESTDNPFRDMYFHFQDADLGSTVQSTNACSGDMVSTGGILVADDAGDWFDGGNPIWPAGSVDRSNSQCTVVGSTSTFPSLNGQQKNFSITVKFKSPWTGKTLRIFMRHRNNSYQMSDWQTAGYITVLGGTAPDLTISKTHSGNFVQGQSGAIYTIIVTNSGGSSTSGTVTVHELRPTGLIFNNMSGSGWTCSDEFCSRSDALAANASYPPISASFNVAFNAPSSLTNGAEVSGGGETNTANNNASDPTVINGAGTVSVTIDTNPTGRTVYVDGGSLGFTAPHTTTWNAGSSHSIGIDSTQNGSTGTRYVFQSWSDSGAATHTVAPSVNTTFVATFNTQYYLTTSASPSQGGSVSPASTWLLKDAAQVVTATSNAGYNFSNYSGDSSATMSSTNIIMNGPKSVVANFVSGSTPVTPESLTSTSSSGTASTFTLTSSSGSFSAIDHVFLNFRQSGNPAPELCILDYWHTSSSDFLSLNGETQPPGRRAIPSPNLVSKLDRCAVDASSSSVYNWNSSTSKLTLTYPTSFSTNSFTRGTWNITAQGFPTSGGGSSSIISFSTFTVVGAPDVKLTSLPTGAGSSQLFSALYDPAGSGSTPPTEMASGELMLNTTGTSTTNSCNVKWQSVQVWLRQDDGGWGNPKIFGNSIPLENSRCKLIVSQSSITYGSGADNRRWVNLKLEFKAAFNGQKIVYLRGIDQNSVDTGYQPRGTWSVNVGQVPNPLSTPPAGSYPNSTLVSLDALGANIRYTLDGSEPSATSGTLYSGSFTISSTATLKAIGYADGAIDSNISTGQFFIGSNNGWFNGGGVTWPHRKLVTISHSQVVGTHSDFPVLYSVTDSALASLAANRIAFTGEDGTTKLKYEIESYDSGTGKLVAWVRVPTVTSSIDKSFYIYYGSPSNTTSQEEKTAVWDSNYKIVNHLKDSGSTVEDSTSNSNHASKSGSGTTFTTAKIGSGYSFDGNNGALTTNANSSWSGAFAQYTAEVWVKFGSVGDYRGAFGIGDWGGPINMWFYNPNTSGPKVTVPFYTANGSCQVYSWEGPDTSDTTGYHHLVMTYNATTNMRKLIVDGEVLYSSSSGDCSGNMALTSNGPALELGGLGGSHRLDATLDEFRISTSERSADWLKTEYRNLNTPSSFYSVGAEQ